MHGSNEDQFALHRGHVLFSLFSLPYQMVCHLWLPSSVFFTMSQAYCVKAKYFRPSAAILTCTLTHCIWPTKASCIRYEGGSSDCECHHFYKARHISGACVFVLALFHSFPGRAFLASGTASSVYSLPCEKRTWHPASTACRKAILLACQSADGCQSYYLRQ